MGQREAPAMGMQHSPPSRASGARAAADGAHLVFLVVGTWVAFTVFGWATEHLTRAAYGESKEKFSFTWFLVLMQSAGNSMVALLALLLRPASRDAKSGGMLYRFTAGVGVVHWLIVAGGYLGAHKFGLLSLLYIIYPLQVLVKSCKTVPVMFGEVLFGTARLTFAKVVNVGMLCAGVVVFSFGKDFKAVSMDINPEIHWDPRTLKGIGLACLGLVCDGIYGPYQNRIKADARKEKREVSSWHLMFNLNFYQGLMALAGCLVTGELPEVIAFVQRNPAVLNELLHFGAAMALGNVFIFALQAGYGSLVVTKTTTVRKVITILFSVWYFGHEIHPGQWAGVALVLLSEPLKSFMDRWGGDKKHKAA
eukprot:TRINITY_DN60119_c0_g1_i1.p1 TRINITY_DN60119_c0_g1~~TRINITY_DN60119_c0_g1_i1.p1  ORF type:complete len:391 (+),score=159.41 TRINITY_DN60119_c0_g1_i1:80-1174(+)